MIGNCYIIPVCVNYQTVIEDSMIGKREFKTKKLMKKIENISLLRIFNPTHKRGNITINFSEPLGMNY